MRRSKTIKTRINLHGLVILCGLFYFSGINISRAQDRCGTVTYTNKLRDQKSILETENQFEEWLQDKIENRKTTLGTQATTYKIPVVVHVIHKGESVGTSSNISDAQIISQIDVLNKDFNRQNTDASSTPAEFLPIAGSMNIEFALAKRSPEGLSTTGIVRVKGTQNSWTMNDNSTLKSLSYWPAEDYMNIWVTDLAGTLIGYAQFPVSSLQGLETSPNNRLTDGVVIDFNNFGASTSDPNYNKGRTATHEVGHFLGLRHIWGDDESASDQCTGTDYVSDTPNQSVSTGGCPTHPQTSCNATTMFQNYMDYTFDRCMNIFTVGQVSRMVSVIENSSRRKSLWTTSQGLDDPVPVANDLGIRQVIKPGSSECSGNFTPTIEVANYGNNTITSARITVKINNVQETNDFTFTPALGTLSMTTLTFNAQSLPAGSYNFEYEIVLTNGVADGRSSDNKQSITTLIPQVITAPFTEPFASTPASWIVTNPDQLFTWENKTAPNAASSNNAMYINLYNYEDSQGQTDLLTTPVFDLTGAQTAYFLFDVAYAQFPGKEDALKVYVMIDCHTDVLQGIEVYNKSGFALATASSTSSAFVPKGEKDWRKEVVDISSFVGESNVQLAFVAVNDWGNNLYIDNVSMVTTAKEDIAITEIISPTPVMCDENITPRLKVKNVSKVISANPPSVTHGDSVASTINTFKVLYALNGQDYESAGTFTPGFLPGKEIEIELPLITFEEGFDSISFKLTEPNGLVDINSTDNERSIRMFVNKSTDHIPLRENFDEDFSDRWTSVNPGIGLTWQPVSTNYNQSVYFDVFNDTIQHNEAWLVSPVLDFSLAEKASMFFDFSYAYHAPFDDQLQILASTDCGSSYKLIPFERTGSMLSTNTSSIPWNPVTEQDWNREYVQLNTLAGEQTVRLAFVFKNKGGNNPYIDNIEFFTSDNPSPTSIGEQYLLYGTNPSDAGDFYITFKLDERQTIDYEVTDVLGKTLVHEQVVDVLNQTFLIDAGAVGTGVYIVRVRIAGAYYTTKVFLNR